MASSQAAQTASFLQRRRFQSVTIFCTLRHPAERVFRSQSGATIDSRVGPLGIIAAFNEPDTMEASPTSCGGRVRAREGVTNSTWQRKYLVRRRHATSRASSARCRGRGSGSPPCCRICSHANFAAIVHHTRSSRAKPPRVNWRLWRKPRSGFFARTNLADAGGGEDRVAAGG